MEDFNTKEVNVPPVTKGDDFVIGEGFKLDETVLEDDPKPAVKRGKKRKKTGVGSALLRIGIIVFTSLFLAFVIILFGAEYLGIGIGRGQEVVVEIEKGSSTRAIAEELKEVNAINSTLMFRLYSKLMGYDGQYQYGVYSFKNELGYSELTELLRTEGAVAESVRVTIPERASVDDIIELLVEKGVCTKSDFINAMDSDRYNYDFVKELPTEQVYYRFEGYLFPDTYEFYCYDNSLECAELAIDKMLAKMNSVLTDDLRKKASDMGYSIHEVLTMASIVELEASGNPEQMKSVALVFYNRLNEWENPLLGSSPTAKYKYGKGRYDTNKNAGIPPGPYCSPSKKAIEAACAPNTECKATYFVTDVKMNFYYTYSLKEHNNIINKLKREKNWIYEYYD
jgi:UPF0755 protein